VLWQRFLMAQPLEALYGDLNMMLYKITMTRTSNSAPGDKILFQICHLWNSHLVYHSIDSI